MAQAQVTKAGQSVLLATFYVRDALCALDAAGVQEVIRLGPVTSVSHAADEVVGIINLRGRIVTVLDAGMRLGFPRIEPNPFSRIFIIEDRGEFIGLLVDRVGEVVEVERNQFEPPPANVSAAQGRFFKGVYRAGRSVIAMVDVDQLLGGGAQ